MQISTIVGAMGASTTRRSSPAAEAWALMFELIHLSKRRFMAIASEFDLSPPQVMALRQLDPDEPKPMSELALALRCDNSNVTGIVDRLEDRGLVERRPGQRGGAGGGGGAAGGGGAGGGVELRRPPGGGGPSPPRAGRAPERAAR